MPDIANIGSLLASVQLFEGLGPLLEERGLWLGLIAVFFGGLALNLTPCVYPMIPVTLAFFGGQVPGSSGRATALAVTYVLGISLSYALLGVIAANTGALLGSWLQQPAVLIGVSVVIVALSLSMFGLYDLRPPRVLTQRLGQVKAGIPGAFAMGLAVGLIAAPCIGPFVLGLFLFVSQLANSLKGFLIFFVLGLGMGLPYIFLALGANSVERLPKSGVWLVWSKKVLGVVLLGLALFFLKPMLSDGVFIWSVTGLLVAAGVYLGWLERSTGPNRLFPWIRGAVGAVLILAGIGAVWPQPEDVPEIAWAPFREATFREALSGDRPVVVDVYADWCIPCLELDHVTFRAPDVVTELSMMATIRLDATSELPDDVQVFLDAYNIYGVPTVLLFDAAGQERRDLRLTGFISPDAFLERLADLK